MSALDTELKTMRNPALGSVLLWRFSTAYSEEAKTDTVPLLVIFLVLPIILHAPSFRHVQSTNFKSGLRVFSAKFADSKPSELDLLLALHDRVSRWREKTRESLMLGVSQGLYQMLSDGQVKPLKDEWDVKTHSKHIRELTFASEKLGRWLAQLALHDISLILHVRF